MKKIPGLEVPSSDVQELSVILDGGRVRYLRSGSGPALLLLHGLLGYSFSWRFVMPALCDRATLYAPDMLGTGFSDRAPGSDFSLRGSAERLLRFLDEVRIDCADLLGTSHGGAVVMMAAALAPQRVRRLILVAPVNPWSARGTRLAPFLSSPPIDTLFVALAPFLKIAHSVLLRRLYGDTRRIRPGTLAGYSAPFAIPGSFRYAVELMRTWNGDLRELESMLPHIAEIPTLLLWGGEDRAVDPASALVLRKHFHHARLTIFEGAGHLPYEEIPEQFNRAVSEFLTSHDTEAGT